MEAARFYRLLENSINDVKGKDTFGVECNLVYKPTELAMWYVCLNFSLRVCARGAQE